MHGALALMVAMLIAACAPDRDAERDAALRSARELYVAGDYEGARDLFVGLGSASDAPPAANLGAARSHQALRENGLALLRYRRALEQRPEDGLAWAGYLETLYQDGSSRGDGVRLETALELAPAALTSAPSQVEIYDTVRRAAAELGRAGEYVTILEVVAEARPDHPVVEVELVRARINAARRAINAAAGSPQPVVTGSSPAVAGSSQPVVTGSSPEAAGSSQPEAAASSPAMASGAQPATPDRAAEAAAVPPGFERRLLGLESELRAWLAGLEGIVGETAPGTAADRREVWYALAVGYDLLDDADRVAAALQELERTDEGVDMAAPLRYRRFLDEWARGASADTATRRALADRGLQRFAPRWRNDGARYRAVLGMQFDVLVDALRRDLAASGVAPAEQLAERVAATGGQLFRIDMGRRAARAVQAAGVLALVPSQYETASRIAADAAGSLEAGAPGLLDPALREPERDEIRRRYRSLLLQIRGQALHNLGRDDDAEATLREAIEAFPAAQSHAVLGGLLLDQGRSAEAYDVLVRALAVGFAAGEEVVEQQARASARAAAAAIGEPAAALDAAVADAAERVVEERAAAIVADPLDIAAPDFVLDDLDGAEWRLSELAGSVVVINFWATWCGPCIAEMPHYQSLVDEYRDAGDVVFLAISTDAEVAAVPRFMAHGGYDFTVLLDQDAAADFDISGVPATFIIGKDGVIKYRTSGFPGAERYLRHMRLRVEALR